MTIQQPSSTRRNVLWLIFFLAVITYFDRLCLSAAAPAITKEFGFSPAQMGWIFSAFSFAYAVFEIPSGWLGDALGTRRALTRIVLCWSCVSCKATRLSDGRRLQPGWKVHCNGESGQDSAGVGRDDRQGTA
ncbi:MAG: MFS transporter [Blastocatellia bacterium]